MKTKTRNLVIGGGAVVVALGGGLWWWRSGSSKPAPAKASTIALAEKKNLEIRAEAAGIVEPIRVVEVKSKASGEVLRVHVETGDRVEAGALLAEIDPRDVQNALEQAQADLESANVKLKTTTAHQERMDALRGSGVVTQQEYESSFEAAASARASAVRARTNLQLAKERRQDVTIRAPIAGTVIEKSVEVAQIIASATSNVSGGTTLFKMADLSAMQVRAKIDETDVGQVKPGQTARVTVEAFPGRSFQGSVLKIEPQAVIEQNVTMFPVLVRLENREDLLRPGMNAEVTVEVATKRDAIVVPNAAVVSMRDARSAAAVLGIDAETLGLPRGPRPDAGGEGELRPGILFVKTAAGATEPRRVMIGLSDWENTEIVKGVEAGEKVVLMSVARLQKEQQERLDRMRQGMGNPMTGGPGGGGARPGGGGRR